MTYTHFSHNGTLRPIDQAVVPLSSVEYSYGFGVYESIRVSKGKIYFADEHCQRLMESAKVIELEHSFTPGFVQQSIVDLLAQNKAATCNLKVLLIGGSTPESANLYILCLNPLFPDRKVYKTGAHCITEPYERPFPQAKTLNMLPSYLAYRRAKQVAAYDALLINQSGNITEGTRTNFYVIKGKTIISPPAADILPGVTRAKVLQVAREQGFEVIEQNIPADSLTQYDGAFLTSTSAKILPLRSIDSYSWATVPTALTELMQTFDEFLQS